MQPVARIEAKRTGSRETVIRVRYQTPEWAGTIARSGNLLVITVWLAGSLALALAAYHRMLGLPAGKSVVAVFAGAALSYWLGWNFDDLLQRRRAARGVIRDALEIIIAPGGVVAEGPGIAIEVRREGEMVFTTQVHRDAKLEEREEQRVQRRLGYAFRDAFEVWVQSGQRFERLAGVADEESARALVRHCQEADERATRGADQGHAFTTRTEPV